MDNLCKSRIRYGIIGCGGIGLAHMSGILRSNNSELIAICDPLMEQLENAKKQFSVNYCYEDYNEMLKNEDIDAIIVATPDQLHEVQTVASLFAGKHVLCEKPMALTLKECKSMIKASERTGKKLMIGQVCRYAPGFKLAKELIDDGQIGSLFMVESEYAHDYSHAKGIRDWRVDAEKLRQPVIGGGCHAVDLLRWIAGNPYEVTAYANRKVLKSWPVDDCTIAILRFPEDIIGKVMVSIGCKRKYTMRSVFYGDNGTIIADNTSPYIVVYKENINSNSKNCDSKVFEGKFIGISKSKPVLVIL